MLFVLIQKQLIFDAEPRLVCYVRVDMFVLQQKEMLRKMPVGRGKSCHIGSSKYMELISRIKIS